MPQKKRQDYEAQAIQPFCDILSQHGLKIEQMAQENVETLRNEWDSFCSGNTRVA